MKKIIFPIILSLLLVALVSAIASVTYTAHYVILEDNGFENVTSTTVSGYSVLGFVCQDLNCATVSNALFPGQPLSTSTDSIVLNFPTSLASPFGYGIYFYKEGYIPGETNVTWAGSGSVSSISYLAKQRNCIAQLNVTNLSTDNSSVKFTALMQSPISNAGFLNYIPTEIQDQYTVDAQVSYQLVDANGSSQSGSSSLSIPFSNSSSTIITIPAVQGDYTLFVTGSITDPVCLNATQALATENISVSGNETDLPPATITNLHTTSITTSSITWAWTNPNDTDFAGVIIYLDGVNVFNSTGNSYIAQGLAKESTHTITIHTIDSAGNVNNTDVSNTATTLSSDSGGNGGGKKKKSGNSFVEEIVSGNQTSFIEDTETISLGNPSNKTNWFAWLIILVLIILIIILVIIISRIK